MAGRGPAPASDHTRTRNDQKTIKLISDGKMRGPSLPRNVIVSKTGEPVAWHKMTVRWWNHWRKSPQALRMMTEPDWDFLLDTALMHHEMWSAKKWEFAAEIRLRVQQFGATPEARARLRLEIAVGRPDEEPTANAAPGTPMATVTSMSSRRDRISAGPSGV